MKRSAAEGLLLFAKAWFADPITPMAAQTRILHRETIGPSQDAVELD